MDVLMSDNNVNCTFEKVTVGGGKRLFPLSCGGKRSPHRCVPRSRLYISNAVGRRFKPNSADDRGRTPLSWAAAGGYFSMVNLLVEREEVIADLSDKRGKTPLHYAAQEGHESVVELRINRTNVTANRPQRFLTWTALCFAALEGIVR